MLIIGMSLYIGSIILANYLVLIFGPIITPINSFFLIGMDLALRDWLHLKISRYQMLLLIITSGLFSYLLNPASGIIAIASTTAFTLSALTDWSVFLVLKGKWMYRANGSNIAGAAVDSLVFPTIAFGVLIPHIIFMQFIMKIIGGLFWALIIQKYIISKNPENKLGINI